MHMGNLPHNCEICGRRVADKYNFDAHKRSHTGESPFSCEICSGKFMHKSTLDRHMRLHSDDEPFWRPMNERSFNLKNQVQKHMVRHSASALNPCQSRTTQRPSQRPLSKPCVDSCESGKVLTCCNRSGIDETLLPCEESDGVSATGSGLVSSSNSKTESHMDLDMDYSSIESPNRDMMLYRKNPVDLGIEVRYEDREFFSCTLCGRVFNDNCNLKRHQAVHTGIKPYSCPICDRCFSRKDNMINHMRVHKPKSHSVTGSEELDTTTTGKFFSREDTG
ncbi:hypothetical protein QAD02_019513 [Eretmocerus hayati]|uniref:Uncharacterized protein n=1 Tax=Eretmocerus hayati TaxID=131215 RepID=A0ACC2PJT4_9HYME|nr:hypothetical protein QAD02_019513 [Eretmocerus hayati]